MRVGSSTKFSCTETLSASEGVVSILGCSKGFLEDGFLLNMPVCKDSVKMSFLENRSMEFECNSSLFLMFMNGLFESILAVFCFVKWCLLLVRLGLSFERDF